VKFPLKPVKLWEQEPEGDPGVLDAGAVGVIDAGVGDITVVLVILVV